MGLTHRLDLLCAKGSCSSRRRPFSYSSSFSMVSSPILAFSRWIRSSRGSCSPGWVLRAAVPAAKNSSRHRLRVAAVTPSCRLSVSRSSPRSRRMTAWVFRWAENRPVGRSCRGGSAAGRPRWPLRSLALAPLPAELRSIVLCPWTYLNSFRGIVSPKCVSKKPRAVQLFHK